MGEVLQPIVTKSYNELHFRLVIPEMLEFADRLEFSTKFMYKNIGSEIDTVLEKATYVDQVGMVFESKQDYSLLPHNKSRKVTISIYKEEKRILFRNASVDFTFLSSDHKKNCGFLFDWNRS